LCNIDKSKKNLAATADDWKYIEWQKPITGKGALFDKLPNIQVCGYFGRKYFFSKIYFIRLSALFSSVSNAARPRGHQSSKVESRNRSRWMGKWKRPRNEEPSLPPSVGGKTDLFFRKEGG
jgi:hypothetical protein